MGVFGEVRGIWREDSLDGLRVSLIDWQKGAVFCLVFENLGNDQLLEAGPRFYIVVKQGLWREEVAV